MLWLVAWAVHAHVGATFEVIDFTRPGPNVEANFGLLKTADARSWEWICHEAVTTPEAIVAPRYSESDRGEWLVNVPALEQAREPQRAVYRSDDGCDWPAVEGLDGHTVTRTAFDPADPDVALAVTANLEPGRTSGVFRSADGGRTFTEVWSATDHLFRTLVPDASLPGTFWASAVWYERNEAWLLRSDDAGLTWTSVAIPIDPDEGTTIQADVIGADGGVAWISLGQPTADRLLRYDGAFTAVFDAGVDLLDATVDPTGQVWVTGTLQHLYRSRDGLTFEPYAEPPGGYGMIVEDGELWVSGFAQFTGRAAYRYDPTTDTFVEQFHLSTLRPPPAGPPDSHVATVCEPLWPGLADRLPQPFVDTGLDTGGTTTTTDEVPEPPNGAAAGGCGCRAGAGAAGVWLVALAAATSRRRRR